MSARLPFTSPLALLPKAINHLLAQEPWARQKLLPHIGKTFKLVVVPFELNLTVDADGNVALAKADATPAVQITAPLGLVPQVLMQGAQSAMHQVKLEGDAEFAQTISYLAQHLRWEAEEDLSKAVGDVAAHRIASATKSFIGQVKTSHEKLLGNVAEYWLEENPQLLRPRHVNAFAEAVRMLRDDAARLEKRIERLDKNNG